MINIEAVKSVASVLCPTKPHIAGVHILRGMGCARREVLEMLGISAAQYAYSLAHCPCSEEDLKSCLVQLNTLEAAC